VPSQDNVYLCILFAYSSASSFFSGTENDGQEITVKELMVQELIVQKVTPYLSYTLPAYLANHGISRMYIRGAKLIIIIIFDGIYVTRCNIKSF